MFIPSFVDAIQHLAPYDHLMMFVGWRSEPLLNLAQQWAPTFQPDGRAKDPAASIAKKTEEWLETIKEGKTPHLATITELEFELYELSFDAHMENGSDVHRQPRPTFTKSVSLATQWGSFVADLINKSGLPMVIVAREARDLCKIVAAEAAAAGVTLPASFWRNNSLAVDPLYEIISYEHRNSVSHGLVFRQLQLQAKETGVLADVEMAKALTALRGLCADWAIAPLQRQFAETISSLRPEAA